MNRLKIYVGTLGATLLLAIVTTGVLAPIAYGWFKGAVGTFLPDSSRNLKG